MFYLSLFSREIKKNASKVHQKAPHTADFRHKNVTKQDDVKLLHDD